jgi:hypothetical protein
MDFFPENKGKAKKPPARKRDEHISIILTGGLRQLTHITNQEKNKKMD